MSNEKQKMVVICGSSRFIQEMAVVAWVLERDEGAIVLSLHLLPHWYPDCPADHLAEHEGVADAMDALHITKLDVAQWLKDSLEYDAEVFVVNPGPDGYIGESTRKELVHAQNLGLPLRFYTTDPVGRVVDELKRRGYEALADSEGQF